MPLLRAALIELLGEIGDDRVQQQERTADDLHRDEVLRTRLPQVSEWLARRAASSRSRSDERGKSPCAGESEPCN